MMHSQSREHRSYTKEACRRGQHYEKKIRVSCIKDPDKLRMMKHEVRSEAALTDSASTAGAEAALKAVCDRVGKKLQIVPVNRAVTAL